MEKYDGDVEMTQKEEQLYIENVIQEVLNEITVEEQEEELSEENDNNDEQQQQQQQGLEMDDEENAESEATEPAMDQFQFFYIADADMIDDFLNDSGYESQ